VKEGGGAEGECERPGERALGLLLCSRGFGFFLYLTTATDHKEHAHFCHVHPSRAQIRNDFEK
jgi:hypothetical protein